jgi:hypothetical protein
MSQPYDFAAFLARMPTLKSREEMLSEADAVCANAERGGPRQRALGGVDYTRRVKDFMYFLHYGARPGGASDQEFQAYRPVVQRLVALGANPAWLRVFD